MVSRHSRQVLQPASAATILGTDWLAYLLSSSFELELLAPAVLWAALFAGIVVALVEGLAVTPLRAATKGLFAALVVSAPGPALGTVVGLLAFAWWLSVRLAEARENSRR